MFSGKDETDRAMTRQSWIGAQKPGGPGKERVAADRADKLLRSEWNEEVELWMTTVRTASRLKNQMALVGT